MSGKTASNMFIDSLNQHSAFGSQFHGADYYQYDAAGAQSIALKQSIRVPVQSSDDIEVNGISIGNIMKVYSWIRNKQWLVGGDILTAGDQTQAGRTDEAKDHLPPLLDRASPEELKALSHSFDSRGELQPRGQIADAEKKRFKDL